MVHTRGSIIKDHSLNEDFEYACRVIRFREINQDIDNWDISTKNNSLN